MTFHGLITGLVVLAVLLGLGAGESWRRSRRRPVDDWRMVVFPRVERWTDHLDGMVAAMEANVLSTQEAQAAFERLGILLSDFRYWRDEWGWEQ